MRNCLCMAFCLITGLLSAQTVDSVALRRVDSLIKVSLTLTAKRDFEQALDVNEVAEKIALDKLGQQSAAYGSCCFNHGRILYAKRDYPGAEKWYLESIAIQGKVQGGEHPDYALTLNNLALLYRIMGQYDKAEPLYFEAIAVRGKALGREHPDYAQSLNGLAILYQEMAQLDKAEPFYLESKAIREKALGREHPDYASSLNNLAALYRRKGEYDKAEPLYLESKTIREKVLGKEHFDYAASLNNLANLYSMMGQYEKAEPYYLETKAIREKALGREHPDYAQCLYNLALMYEMMGQYEKAEPPYLEAKNIWGKALGREHPDYAASLNNLANLYSVMSQYEKAEPFLLELSSVNRRIVERALHHLSESELNDFLDNFSNNSLSQNQTLSFTQKAASKKMVPVCYDNSLFYKGFLLQSVGRIKQLALSDEGAAEKYILLKGYHRRLATQYAQPIAKQDSALVAQLETKANDLEKDLARTVAGWGQALQQVKWQEVQTALKPNEAAIEFVSYRFYRKKQTDSILYAALVLLPGTDSPKFIHLFEEKQLTAFLKTEGSPQPTFYNDLYSAGKKGDQLYDLIWKPIAAALPQGTTVYCSPSGLLHRLNLGAIPTPDGKTLAEKNRLTMLGSTRQLVIPLVSTTQQSATAQLYGGIQYDATPNLAANTPAKPEDLAARRGPSIAQNDSTLRGENWNYLRWTEVEISAAANVMKSKGILPTLKKGAEATEESFKALGQGSASPRILHLATHGFFFPDPKESKPGEGQVIGEKTFKVSDNPMIRSGLVLAGGNYAWKTGKPLRPDLEDGILIAYEISQMNLANTELVVLSACETGLGDLVGNEGVYGLQRAFKIAGAKYLIMSLWQVPDFQTQVFMTAFYKHWLERRMAVPEAFRATQAELRGKYSGEAFKWAGFVLVE
ncbi:CHAT domain-containing tetratricopeptide repeat protein [Haliscomenobacter sp.]|uniref:CHAT domain-containing protein n=1 Tax=Haliscomenobacter sp. TaxID=2717303 RepID=UPI0033651C3F